MLRALLALAALALAPAAAHAAPIADEIIVKRAPGLTAPERADVRADAGVRLERTIGLPRVEVVTARPGDRARALAELDADPDVVWAEPNQVREAVTADDLFVSLWGLENTGQYGGTPDADIDAPDAWAFTKGAGVSVGVVDSGVLLTHPDLVPAGNPGEQGTTSGGADKRTNGVDDDGNGRVDDWRGWDWVGGDNDPTDGHGHGTHVSGTIAAVEDTAGIVGVAPQARTVALRVLGDSGSGSTASSAAAFDYAGDLGLRVVNASIGSDGYSSAERSAMAAHPNTLYVVAAGNAGRDNDTAPTYPCAYDLANIVCVGATDRTDARASFSNTGLWSVDLFAPGVQILSSTRDGTHGWMSGTSMASPHVAGTAALLFAQDPTLTAGQAKQALLGTVDVLTGLAGLAVTGGRLNAASALAAPAAPVDTAAPSTPGGLTATGGLEKVTLDWADNAEADFGGYRVYSGASATPLAFPRTSAYERSGLSPGTTYAFRVTAIDRYGNESAPTAYVYATTTAPEVTDPPDTDGRTEVLPDDDVVLDDSDEAAWEDVEEDELEEEPAPATLSAIRLSGRAVLSRRRGRARSARLSFRAGAAGAVRVTLSRRVCRGRRCAYVARGTRTLDVPSGAQRWTVGPRVAGLPLAAGAWRITLATADAVKHVRLRVRRR